jgi:signal transduction histidine kinase
VPDHPELLQYKNQLAAVQRVSEALFQTIDLDQLVETTLRIALEEVGAEAGSILLADPDAKQLVFQYSIGEKPVPRGTTIAWDQGISGAVFQSGEPRISSDVSRSSSYYREIDRTTGFVTRDMLTLPLRRWRGEPIGVLNVLNKKKGTLDEQDLGLLRVISAFAALAIQQALLFENTKKAEVVTLLGDIGHDLKNLLQPVLSGSVLLKTEVDELFSDMSEEELSRKKGSQSLCDEAAGMVASGIERLHDRVKEMADCVKGLSAPPNFAPCRLADVVDEVLRTLKVVANEKTIDLRADGLDALPVLKADERRLYNMFYNLVNNAIPETPPGGSITVRGRRDPDGARVAVSVVDTGRGRDPGKAVLGARRHDQERRHGPRNENRQRRRGCPQGQDLG